MLVYLLPQNVASSNLAATVVIVSETPLSAQARQELVRKSPDEAALLYAGRRYTRVDGEGLTLMFSPRLWAKKELEGLNELWKDLGRSVRPDGTLNLKGSPALASWVADVFDSIGLEAPGETALGIDAQSTLTLTSEGITKVVSLNGANASHALETLGQRPAQRRDPRIPNARPAKTGYPGVVASVESMCVYAQRGWGSTPARQMRATSRVGTILAERYEKAQAQRRALQEAFAAQVPGLDPLKGVRKGDRVDELSKDIQWQLRKQFIDGPVSSGFKDADEAERWLQRATVASAATSYAVQFVTGSRDVTEFVIP